MTHYFNIKKYSLLTIVLWLSSFSLVQAQELSDQEIGLDVARITAALKERGITDASQVNQEVVMMREMYKRAYYEQQRVQDQILQKNKTEQKVENSTSRAVLDIPATEKAALQALYNATNGNNWTNSRNWDFNTPVTDGFESYSGWFGIRISNGHIVEIILPRNNLTGTLPIEIGDLPYLGRLDLNSNLNLQGVIPNSIGNLNNLYYLALSGCNFTGSIPSQIGGLHNLRFLYLHINKLSGSIPSSINGLTSVEHFFLHMNMLTGELPLEIGQLVNVKIINLGLNQISGNIPLQIGNLQFLDQLYLGQNLISGSIPSEVMNLPSLGLLNLSSNRISGSIPNFRGSNLVILFLNDNLLGGELPNSIGVNLKFFYAYNNLIGGEIPFEFSTCDKMIYLRLDNNKLSGKISVDFSRFSSLRELNISTNMFSGILPNFSNCTSLQTLNLSTNNFRFIDFIDQYNDLKSRLQNFSYDPQAKIDTPLTITETSGRRVELKMCMDDRYHQDDTYQWYKNGILITGATSRIYAIPSVALVDAGTYTCKSYHTTNPDMSPLVLEREPITLNVTPNACPSFTAEIYPGIGVTCAKDVSTPCAYTCGTFIATPTLTNINTTVDLSTVTYNWTFKAPDNTVLYTSTLANPQYNLTLLGNNTIELVITDAQGCKYTFSKIVTVIACPCIPVVGQLGDPCPDCNVKAYTCGARTTAYKLYTTTTGLTYAWTFKDPNGNVLGTSAEEIGSFTFTVPGVNTFELTVTDSNGCKTSFSATTLVVKCCTPIQGTIYKNSGLVDGLPGQGYICGDRTETFGLNTTATGLIYDWTFKYPNGNTLVTSGPNPSNTFTIPGTTIIELVVTESNGCKTTFSTTIEVVSCVKQCLNEKITFTSSVAATGATYTWTTTNSSGLIVNTQTNTAGYYEYTPTTIGNYTVSLLITTTEGCQSTFTKQFLVEECKPVSCVLTNPRTAIVKQLFINLLNHLRTQVASGVVIPTSGYECAELNLLKPFIIDRSPKIYGFTSDFSTTKFWFHPVGVKDQPDVFLQKWDQNSQNITDINLKNYIDSNSSTDLGNGLITLQGGNGIVQNAYVRHINFCPECSVIEGKIEAKANELCSKKPIQFNLNTTATNLVYNWTFYAADGSVLQNSSLVNPTVTYPTAGTYNVVLEVFDNLKCSTKFTFTSIVKDCDCETHFAFAFATPKGSVLNNAKRLNIGQGVVGFVNANLNKSMFVTSVDDYSRRIGFSTVISARFGALQTLATTSWNPPTVDSNGEIKSGPGNLLSIQSRDYDRTILNELTAINANTLIDKKLDVFFVFASQDRFTKANMTALKAQYQNLISTNGKAKKVFFVLAEGGSYLQIGLPIKNYNPVNFVQAVIGKTPVNYTTTGNVLNSDYIIYTQTQLSASNFENTLQAFMQKAYDDVVYKKCDINPCEVPVTGTIEILNNTEEYVCGNRNLIFNFNTTSTNLTYDWRFLSPTGVEIGNSTLSQPQFLFTIPGINTVNLKITNANGCVTTYTYKVDMQPSCTLNNINTPVVKQLFINLINHLKSQASIPNSYTCPELIALSPYTSDKHPKIYNYSITNGKIQFWLHPNYTDAPDVVMQDWNIGTSPNLITLQSVDVSNYCATDKVMNLDSSFTLSNGVKLNYGRVKHVNFCPTELCKLHIAIVVDESGSISDSEARKIRSQLKNFVKKQAVLNASIGTSGPISGLSGSNTIVSLIGLSDKDAPSSRTDEINGNNKTLPVNLTDYITWIDAYKDRYNAVPRIPGVSRGSDYWNSGLQKAQELGADYVILITDGCQSANVDQLKATMAKFDNYQQQPRIGAHLYVIGIENGYYIDESTVANKFITTSNDEITSKDSSNNEEDVVDSKESQDPNVNSDLLRTSTTERAEGYLKKSLKYLLNYGNIPVPQFPIANKYEFLTADYSAHEDFVFLGKEDNYFYNNFVQISLTCGTKLPNEDCDDCVGYQPIPNKEYILSAWVKEERNDQVISYSLPKIRLSFKSANGDGTPNNGLSGQVAPPIIVTVDSNSGDIIEGWQRMFKKFTVPVGTEFFDIELLNESESIPVYFDDIRIHPVDGSMKSFVYDPENFRLMSELDENNYSTFYEYDKEGGLVRVKKETAKGIKTIQETRSGNVIKN